MPTDIELAWAGGVFSAFGIASRRGRKPSLMVQAFTREVPDRLQQSLKLGQVMSGLKVRWVCDEPHEVAAFFRLVGPHLIVSRRELVEDAWKDWRIWMQEKKSEDPGDIEDYGHAEVQERIRPKRRATWALDSMDVPGEMDAWQE